MMMRLKWSSCVLLIAVLLVGVSVAQAEDEEILDLANSSGCFICHLVTPAKKTRDVPLAPSYQEIALRYKGDKEAFDRLLDRVLHGTVYRDQVWAGKVGMRFMPPNVNISRETAATLVHWVLGLEVDAALAERLTRYDAMLSLATVSGCTICHRVDPVKELRVVPLAPSFRAIAAQYSDKANSRKKLIDSVVHGTQGKQRVWDNVNMLFMPPNVALKKSDAESLVEWILSLDTTGVTKRISPPVRKQ